MSLLKPRVRLLESTASSLLPHSHFYPLLACPPLHQRRTVIKDYLKNPFRSRGSREVLDVSSPEFLKKREEQKAKAEKDNAPNPTPGDLAPGSIFDKVMPEREPGDDVVTVIRNPRAMSAALDPQPQARARWQRKMVIREIRGRWRLNKTEKLLRTERSHLSKSDFFKTSVKKLFPLANQIAGKPLNEAMVQMRFSKKKAAQDVLKHLESARDQAIVTRGMGLGKVNGQPEPVEGKEKQEPEQQKPKQELLVEDKYGKRRVVTDPTAIYIDEAWVGRGPYRFAPESRARGRINRLSLPYTSISVVLKEEATRIRQADEREQKRQRKKVWVPLPDRPVTAQRQYPLW